MPEMNGGAFYPLTANSYKEILCPNDRVTCYYPLIREQLIRECEQSYSVRLPNNLRARGLYSIKAHEVNRMSTTKRTR